MAMPENLPGEGKMSEDLARLGTEGMLATLAHHDAMIVNVASRVTNVENSLKTLSTEVNRGFQSIQSSMAALVAQIDKIELRPTFDFAQVVRTVKDVAILLGATVGAIIWITTGHFASSNTEAKVKAELQVQQIELMTERMSLFRKKLDELDQLQRQRVTRSSQQ